MYAHENVYQQCFLYVLQQKACIHEGLKMVVDLTGYHNILEAQHLLLIRPYNCVLYSLDVQVGFGTFQRKAPEVLQLTDLSTATTTFHHEDKAGSRTVGEAINTKPTKQQQ